MWGGTIELIPVTQAAILVDRRFVIGGTAALVGAAALSPQASAHQRRGSEPTGQIEVLTLSDTKAVDVSTLNPGELVVVAVAETYYGILHRTAAQIAAVQAETPMRVYEADSDRVQEATYLVLNLACPHKGCQVGYDNVADIPFNCPCHRSRFDASGRVLGGPARFNLGVPDYAISGTIVTFA